MKKRRLLFATKVAGGSYICVKVAEKRKAVRGSMSLRATVRAITRNPNSDAAKALTSQGAQVIQANFDDENSLAKAFEVGPIFTFSKAREMFRLTIRHDIETGRPRNLCRNKLLGIPLPWQKPSRSWFFRTQAGYDPRALCSQSTFFGTLHMEHATKREQVLERQVLRSASGLQGRGRREDQDGIAGLGEENNVYLDGLLLD